MTFSLSKMTLKKPLKITWQGYFYFSRWMNLARLFTIFCLKWRSGKGGCERLFAFVHVCSRLLAFAGVFAFAFVNVCQRLFALARICSCPLCRAPLCVTLAIFCSFLTWILKTIGLPKYYKMWENVKHGTFWAPMCNFSSWGQNWDMPAKKTLQKKKYPQNFRGIVPGFSGDLVYVVFSPEGLTPKRAQTNFCHLRNPGTIPQICFCLLWSSKLLPNYFEKGPVM